MEQDIRLKRLRYRAWHRGTREADLMIGGFFDRHAADLKEPDLVQFEALMDEQDVDIMAWAMGTLPCPPAWDGELMRRMRALDFVPTA